MRVWEVGRHATLPVLRGHTSYVYPVAFSPDGRWIASGSWDGTVRLWDAATGEACATLPHPGVVRTLAYGPDGDWLVTGGDRDDRLRIWDIATARVRKELRGLGPVVAHVVVSPDGARVAASTYDEAVIKGNMIVCDVASGERLFSAPGAPLNYSPDGATLVSGSGDSTVRLWDTAPLKARYQARRAAEALRPEAERLIEQLWQQKKNPDEVVESLRADRALGEPLRHAALRAVLRRASLPAATPGNALGSP